jgi:hypothetical protein
MSFDFLDMAARRSEKDFVAACPFPFLLGRVALSPPRMPRRTMTFNPKRALEDDVDPADQPAPEPGAPILLAVRKSQDAFPGMITIGRTRNHDVYIADVQVSKFHAFFQTNAGRLELTDAGSSNGTRVGAVALQKGRPQPVHLGDTVHFGQLEFTLLDAATVWTRLRDWKNS